MNFGRKGEDHHPIICSAADTREAFQQYRRHFWGRSQRKLLHLICSIRSAHMWMEWMLILAVSGEDSEKHTHQHTHLDAVVCGRSCYPATEKVDIILAHSCSLWEQLVLPPRGAEFRRIQQQNCSSNTGEEVGSAEQVHPERDPLGNCHDIKMICTFMLSQRKLH